MRKFFWSFGLMALLAQEASAQEKACYCYLYNVEISKNVLRSLDVEYVYDDLPYIYVSSSGHSVSKIDAFASTMIMPESHCDGKVHGGVQRIRGKSVLDQEGLNAHITELKNSLVSYIDRRHEEIKVTLLANINRINQEAMNDLLVQDTFLLKNGLAEVLKQEPVNEKLVEALQHYKVPPDLLKNGIVAVIRDSTEVRDELINALQTYSQIPEDSVNMEDSPER